MRKNLIERVIGILESGVDSATAPEETRLRAFCRGMQREPDELFMTAEEATADDVPGHLRSAARHALQSYDRLGKASQEVIAAVVLILKKYPAEDDYAKAA